MADCGLPGILIRCLNAISQRAGCAAAWISAQVLIKSFLSRNRIKLAAFITLLLVSSVVGQQKALTSISPLGRRRTGRMSPRSTRGRFVVEAARQSRWRNSGEVRWALWCAMSILPMVETILRDADRVFPTASSIRSRSCWS